MFGTGDSYTRLEAEVVGVALVDSILVFVVSLLVGGLGIYVGARLVVDAADYTYAVVTALLGAVVWTVAGSLLGWIPLLGPATVLLAYLALIRYRYPGGWWDAILISLAAWVATFAVLYVLALLGVGDFGAIGVPGPTQV